MTESRWFPHKRGPYIILVLVVIVVCGYVPIALQGRSGGGGDSVDVVDGGGVDSCDGSESRRIQHGRLSDENSNTLPHNRELSLQGNRLNEANPDLDVLIGYHGRSGRALALRYATTVYAKFETIAVVAVRIPARRYEYLQQRSKLIRFIERDSLISVDLPESALSHAVAVASNSSLFCQGNATNQTLKIAILGAILSQNGSITVTTAMEYDGASEIVGSMEHGLSQTTSSRISHCYLFAPVFQSVLCTVVTGGTNKQLYKYVWSTTSVSRILQAVEEVCLAGAKVIFLPFDVFSTASGLSSSSIVELLQETVAAADSVIVVPLNTNLAITNHTNNITQRNIFRVVSIESIPQMQQPQRRKLPQRNLAQVDVLVAPVEATQTISSNVGSGWAGRASPYSSSAHDALASAYVTGMLAQIRTNCSVCSSDTVQACLSQTSEPIIELQSAKEPAFRMSRIQTGNVLDCASSIQSEAVKNSSKLNLATASPTVVAKSEPVQANVSKPMPPPAATMPPTRESVISRTVPLTRVPTLSPLVLAGAADANVGAYDASATTNFASKLNTTQAPVISRTEEPIVSAVKSAPPLGGSIATSGANKTPAIVAPGQVKINPGGTAPSAAIGTKSPPFDVTAQGVTPQGYLMEAKELPVSTMLPTLFASVVSSSTGSESASTLLFDFAGHVNPRAFTNLPSGSVTSVAPTTAVSPLAGSTPSPSVTQTSTPTKPVIPITPDQTAAPSPGAPGTLAPTITPTVSATTFVPTLPESMLAGLTPIPSSSPAAVSSTIAPTAPPRPTAAPVAGPTAAPATSAPTLPATFLANTTTNTSSPETTRAPTNVVRPTTLSPAPVTTISRAPSATQTPGTTVAPITPSTIPAPTGTADPGATQKPTPATTATPASRQPISTTEPMTVTISPTTRFTVRPTSRPTTAARTNPPTLAPTSPPTKAPIVVIVVPSSPKASGSAMAMSMMAMSMMMSGGASKAKGASPKQLLPPPPPEVSSSDMLYYAPPPCTALQSGQRCSSNSDCCSGICVWAQRRRTASGTMQQKKTRRSLKSMMGGGMSMGWSVMSMGGRMSMSMNAMPIQMVCL